MKTDSISDVCVIHLYIRWAQLEQKITKYET